jgi:hypothetical protein
MPFIVNEPSFGSGQAFGSIISRRGGSEGSSAAEGRVAVRRSTRSMSGARNGRRVRDFSSCGERGEPLEAAPTVAATL